MENSKWLKFMGHIMGQERAAPKRELQSSVDFSHKFLSCNQHIYVKKLLRLEKELLETNRQDHPWSLHEVGNNLFAPAGMETTPNIQRITVKLQINTSMAGSNWI